MSEVQICPICGAESFENQTECILHCKKNEWYSAGNEITTHKNEKTFWSAFQKSLGLHTVFDNYKQKFSTIISDALVLTKKNYKYQRDLKFSQELHEKLMSLVRQEKYNINFKQFIDSLYAIGNNDINDELLNFRANCIDVIEEIFDAIKQHLTVDITIIKGVIFPKISYFGLLTENNFNLLAEKNNNTGSTLSLLATFTFQDCHFYGQARFIEIFKHSTIDSTAIDCIFHQCTFHKYVEFKHNDDIGLHFYSCIFNGQIKTNRNGNQVKHTSNVTINKSILNNEVTLNTRELKLAESEFNAKTTLNGGKIASDKCKFTDEVIYSNCTLTDQKSRFSNKLNIPNGVKNNLTFEKSIFMKDCFVGSSCNIIFNFCKLNDVKYTQNGNTLEISGDVAGNIQIESQENTRNNFNNININLNHANSILINGYTAQSETMTTQMINTTSSNINIRFCTKNVIIYNCEITNGFILSVDECNKLLLIKSNIYCESNISVGNISNILKINQCVLRNSFVLQQNTNLTNNINYIQITNSKLSDTSEVILKDISLNQLELSNLLNYSKFFKVSNVKITKSLKISESLIPSLYLTGIIFDKGISEITFKDTSFMDVSFNNVIWPENLEFIFNKEESHPKNRDTCRQLKKVHENQGNIIDSNRFYALEMKAYGKTIPKLRLSEKIIFGLGEKTSNFAQDWTLPLFWMFTLALYNLVFNVAYKCDHLRLIEILPKEIYAAIVPIVLFSIVSSIFIIKKTRKYKRIIFLSTSSIITFILYGYTFVSSNIISSYIIYPIERLIRVFNPLDIKTADGHPILWFTSKAIFAFLLYQFVVATRRQTKR
ncbi:MAG: hypothetical protein AB7E76_08650 [Deferribacterales bacterium]